MPFFEGVGWGEDSGFVAFVVGIVLLFSFGFCDFGVWSFGFLFCCVWWGFFVSVRKRVTALDFMV